MKTKIVIFGYTSLVLGILDLLEDIDAESPLIVLPSNRRGKEVDVVAVSAELKDLQTIYHNKPSAWAFQEKIRGYRPELGISASYSHILSKEILDIPSKGCVNLHGSLLPRYRGPHTLNWQIINGERESGVTLHYVDEGVDTGDIIDQEPFTIRDDDIAEDIKPRIDRASIDLLRRNLPGIIRGNVHRRPQDPSQATLFPARRPQDGLIDFSWPIVRIYNFIRALARPYPGAFYDTPQPRKTIDRYKTLSWVAILKNSRNPISCLSKDGVKLIPLEDKSPHHAAESSGCRNLTLSLETGKVKVGKWVFSAIDLGMREARLEWHGSPLSGHLLQKTRKMAFLFGEKELGFNTIHVSSETRLS